MRRSTRAAISLLACLFAIPGFFSSAARSAPSNSTHWAADTRTSLEKMAATLENTLKPWPVPDRTFRVQNFGAVGDGLTMNTQAIQRAIDACSAAGGGVVLLDHGDFVSGTIDLKSGVMLDVERGARILGSLRISDYPPRVPAHLTLMDTSLHIKMSLIYAEGCRNIGIRGEGTIDGRGTAKNFPRKLTGPHPGVSDRPFLLRILNCSDVTMNGIHLRDSAAWMEDYVNCDNLILDGINVENQGNYNNDGFDIDGCRNVIARNCFINSWDDGMCFKGAGLRTMQNVLVENCTAYSGCNPLKFGTNSEADFDGAVIRNVKLGGVPKNLPAFKRRYATSGISWESVDGGTVENILVTGAQINRVDSPLFLRLGNRSKIRPDGPNKGPGKLRRIIFDQITAADNGTRGSIFAGIPGAQIEDVVVQNMNVSMAGGGKPQPARTWPENESDYPDSNMFGLESPAYGFWMRHCVGISFQNLKITPTESDARPPFFADNDSSNILVNGAPISAVLH